MPTIVLELLVAGIGDVSHFEPPDKAGIEVPPMYSDRVKLPTATVEIKPDSIRTTLPDGAETVAKPTDTPEDRERANSLGYDSPHDMDRDHDLTHSLLATWLGLPVSPVLDGIANDRPLTKAQSSAEEAAVLAIQRFAQEQGVDLSEVAQRMSASKQVHLSLEGGDLTEQQVSDLVEKIKRESFGAPTR